MKLRRVAVLLAVSLVAGYLALCALAHFGYRRVLYPAPQADETQAPAGARVLELRAADGVVVHAMAFANGAAPLTVVLFHGNGEVIGDDVGMAQALVNEGFAVTLVEYRGYGRSAGITPSEGGLYADAAAVLDDLAAHGVGADRVVLWGQSLGTGVAVEMARRARGAALVLVSPYTSIVDMAARIAPFLPVRLLVGDRLDSVAKAPSLALPTVVVHGTEDEVIPFAMGQRVAASIAGSRFERVEGGHHMDCFAVDPRLLGRVAGAVTAALAR